MPPIPPLLYQIIEGTLGFASVLDADGMIEHICQSGLDAVGLTLEEVKGTPFATGPWFSYDPALQHRMEAAVALATQGISSRHDEITRTAGDGRARAIFQLIPLRAPDGTVTRLLSTGHEFPSPDMAHQPTAAELREMRHRNKNLVSSIRSMAKMTQRTAPPLEAMDAFIARLDALTAAHGTLSAGLQDTALFEDIAGRILRPHGASREAVSIRGPSLPLQPEPARQLALCLHELATNAVKYGALSTPQGRVDLELSHPDKTGAVVLTWAERDGPPIREPTHSGYGSLFVRASMLKLFGSRCEIRYWPAGFRLRAQGPGGGLFAQTAPGAIETLRDGSA
ncbi:sensor histidine kinase [Pseudoroseicyclus aestuarii]|uniref:histidine kinase n=1 Tax=Pseudoroseicyclus aestuarii TaxID=1795041 RepID=A0A318SVL1_9RHOB|nr:PAS domain-containing sensor histidine kinase [Pseudoroseicyclus aestuarii]PYE85890.1 two-component sensor histidine kinase [Pseudoroseicyclus aestuarii]